ncbi:hypothetical protein FQA39_LY02369 [Lamprigera yunnana]|nr:hypothetical protein FQA39_LY02369 [Lamprigera yunnana]
MEKKCPQCNSLLESPLSRLVQDTCGHKKCRLCLLQDESECQICIKSSTESTEKEDDFNSNNYAGVIACNKTSVVNNVSDESIMENISKEGQQKRIYEAIVLPNHIAVVTANPPIYKCNVCEKFFKTKSHVKYHSFCGNGQKPLQCNKCDKGFVNRYHLEVHLLIHSNLKPHKCDICHKGFTTANKLNRHKLVHSHLKHYICQQCGKSFKNKDYLQRHSIIHTAEKPFPCKLCEAQFNNRSNLNKHQLTHSKEKIHMCDACGKRFKFKNALTTHRQIHTKQRPHVCSNCSKTFVNAKELHRHQLIHAGIKNYSCSLCNVSFVRKDNLQRHIRNSHPGKKAKPVTKAKEQHKKELNSQVPTENPNAIKVITASPVSTSTSVIKSEPNKQPPVINAPVKLAFKTTAFKNNYNISSREYHVEPPRLHPKSYDYEESVNICKKILSPCSPPRTIIKTLGKISEKDSNEICQRILTPAAPPITTDISIENPPSIIRNIKFKLPPKYLNLSKPNILDDMLKPPLVSQEKTKKEIIQNCTYTELKPALVNNSATSVIVNSHSNYQHEVHWRRSTLQTLQQQAKQKE